MRAAGMVDFWPMRKNALIPWLLAILSAFLLLLPFSIAGPVPWWRTLFAWVALVPLLIAILDGTYVEAKRYLLRKRIVGLPYRRALVSGKLLLDLPDDVFLGGISAIASAGILLAYSLILGLYFACFGLLVSLIAKSSRSIVRPLIAAPFLWVALEFAASRITSVPWDQTRLLPGRQLFVNRTRHLHWSLRPVILAGIGERAARVGSRQPRSFFALSLCCAGCGSWFDCCSRLGTFLSTAAAANTGGRRPYAAKPQRQGYCGMG